VVHKNSTLHVGDKFVDYVMFCLVWITGTYINIRLENSIL